MEGVLKTVVIALGILFVDEGDKSANSVDEYLC